MREPERDPGRLQDIIQAADNIASFMLSVQFKEQHKEIPWKEIIGMRHVLVHGYATVLVEILWHTATEDVPLIKKQIEAILRR